MISNEQEIIENWGKCCEDVEQFLSLNSTLDGVDLKIRSLTGLYFIASHCYHYFNESIIIDATFDALCNYLSKNFDLCISEGADLLDKDLLECHSGYKANVIAPYRSIAYVLAANSRNQNQLS